MTGDAAYWRALRAANAANRPLVKCDGCACMFQPKRSNQRYHSRACKQKAYRLRLGRPTVTDKRIPVTQSLANQ